MRAKEEQISALQRQLAAMDVQLNTAVGGQQGRDQAGQPGAPQQHQHQHQGRDQASKEAQQQQQGRDQASKGAPLAEVESWVAEEEGAATGVQAQASSIPSSIHGVCVLCVCVCVCVCVLGGGNLFV